MVGDPAGAALSDARASHLPRAHARRLAIERLDLRPGESVLDVACGPGINLPGLRDRYPIAYLGVFGSWVRGEQDADSDLDILVDFDGSIGWEIVTLEQELSRELGLRVDLVPRQGPKPFIGRRILDEVVPV